MIRVTIKDLEELENSGKRPKGYVKTCMDLANRVDKEACYFTKEVFDDLRKFFTTKKPTEIPKPKKDLLHKRCKNHKGPGSHLKDVIEERFGSIPKQGCGCSSMLTKMDRWGVEECKVNRNVIINHMVGQTDMLPKKYKFVLKLPGGKHLAKSEAGKMLDEALKRAEESKCCGGKCKKTV